MMTQTTRQPRCPACRSAESVETTYVREFNPHGETVKVNLLRSCCTACAAEFTTAAQHDQNLVRLKERKAQYRELLLGEEMLALRRRYGITQQQAAKLFGKGKIAFSRYENETSYPDATTTKLLTLAIDKPDVVKALADKAGVTLPLWEARCEDERRAKVRIVSAPEIGGLDAPTRRWAQHELMARRHTTLPGPKHTPTRDVWTEEALDVQAKNDDSYTRMADYA